MTVLLSMILRVDVEAATVLLFVSLTTVMLVLLPIMELLSYFSLYSEVTFVLLLW